MPNASTSSARRGLLARLAAWFGVASVLPVLDACTTVDVQPAPELDLKGSWAVLPLSNHTETPQAGLRAESILESLVRSAGITNLRRYPANLASDTLFEPAERRVVDQALAWARGEKLRYGLTGSVQEWRYKVGVDGEPAVGISLQLLDLSSGAVIWTASGSKTGWSREALSGVAQKLLAELTAPLAAPFRAAQAEKRE